LIGLMLLMPRAAPPFALPFSCSSPPAAFDPDQQPHGDPNANNQEVGGPDEAHMRIYVGRLRRRSGGALVCIGKH
jgi:hypothetical protein